MDSENELCGKVVNAMFSSYPTLKVSAEVNAFITTLTVANARIIAPAITNIPQFDIIFFDWVSKNFYINKKGKITKNNVMQKDSVQHSHYINFLDYYRQLFTSVDYFDVLPDGANERQKFLYDLVRKILFIYTKKREYCSAELMEKIRKLADEEEKEINTVIENSELIEPYIMDVYNNAIAEVEDEISEKAGKEYKRYGTLYVPSNENKIIEVDNDIIYFTTKNNLSSILNKYFEFNGAAYAGEFEIKPLNIPEDKKHAAAKLINIVDAQGMKMPRNSIMKRVGNKFMYISKGERREMKYSFITAKLSDFKNIDCKGFENDNVLIFCKDKIALAKHTADYILNMIK